MAIENRNLEAGTKLAARYKGQTHTAEVVKTDEGIRYKLGSGEAFKSLSKAGSHVMNGVACNGCPCGMELHKGTHIQFGRWLSSCAAKPSRCVQ